MKVLVIGCGSIGTRHARNLKALGHTPVVFDRDRDRSRALEMELGCPPWDGNFDAAMICTPAATHASTARRLLELGYEGALFIEKPLAISLEDAEVFTRWPHPVTMVGYQCRFHYMARAMRAMFDPVLGGTFTTQCDMQTWPGRDYGPFLLECSHDLDLALWCGAPAVVDGAILSETTASIKLGNWWVYINAAFEYYMRDWSVFGRTHGYQWAAHSPDEIGDRIYVDELAHFLSCVEENRPTITPFADGLRVLDVIAQAYTKGAGVLMTYPQIIPVEQWDAEKFRQLQEEHAQFRIVRIVPKEKP